MSPFIRTCPPPPHLFFFFSVLTFFSTHPVNWPRYPPFLCGFTNPFFFFGLNKPNTQQFANLNSQFLLFSPPPLLWRSFLIFSGHCAALCLQVCPPYLFLCAPPSNQEPRLQSPLSRGQCLAGFCFFPLNFFALLSPLFPFLAVVFHSTPVSTIWYLTRTCPFFPSPFPIIIGFSQVPLFSLVFSVSMRPHCFLPFLPYFPPLPLFLA